MHLEHPVPQRVHDHLQHLRVAHVQAVAAAGVVLVVRRALGRQSVVRGVVDAAEAQGRPAVVALGGVVVDDVEDHLDPGAVQRLDHVLELEHRVARSAARAVRRVRRQVAERVVAPVVAQPALDQEVLGHEVVHRHELERGHAQLLQVLDDHRVRERRIRPAHVLGDVGMARGEALDVRLVDHRVVPVGTRRPVLTPVEERVDDHRARHVGRAVARVGRPVRIAHRIAEHALVPGQLARDRLGIRIEQQLGRVTALAARRLVRSVDAIAVALTRPHARQIAVPAEGRRFRQVDALLFALGVVQT